MKDLQDFVHRILVSMKYSPLNNPASEVGQEYICVVLSMTAAFSPKITEESSSRHSKPAQDFSDATLHIAQHQYCQTQQVTNANMLCPCHTRLRRAASPRWRAIPAKSFRLLTITTLTLGWSVVSPCDSIVGVDIHGQPWRQFA